MGWFCCFGHATSSSKFNSNVMWRTSSGPKSRRDFFMNWATRAAICVGTARGLVFLHEEAPVQFVHRDIKASNILLDKDLTPKIGDFGLAKLFPDSVSHISTRAVGTMGYLAPEYALLGQLTKKADVYSFGVLVLEMVSGKSSFLSMWDGDAPESLLEWAWRLRDDENRLLEMVDVELANDGYPSEEALRFIKVALVCTQAAAQQRPTMTQVLQLLLLSTHSEPSIMQANLPLLNVRNLSEPIALIRRSRNNVVSKNHALCKIQLSTASEDTSRSPRKRTAAYCTALNSTSVATSKQDNNNSYQMTKLQPRQINKDIASTYQMTDLHPR